MIKKIDDSDLEQAAYIHSVSWKESHKDICSEEFIEEHTVARQKKYLKNLMDDNVDIYMLVMECPVGIVSVRDGHVIENLYVLPIEQNKGYGTKLLLYAVDIIKKCNNIPSLWILNINEGAKRLYERNGFSVSGRIKKLSETLSEIEMFNSE